MPDLSHSLHGYDLGHLHIIAELWGLELEAPDVRHGRKNLTKRLLDSALVAEIVEALPKEASEAIGDLVGNDGRIAWTQFTQRYGEVREMGEGRREREKPHRNSISTSEILWYRALIARAFFDTETGPLEFAYIPENLIPLLPPLSQQTDFPLSRPAMPKERKHVRPANDLILDDATTLLAAIRLGFEEEKIEPFALYWQIPPATLTSLLKAAKLLDEEGQPVAEDIRSFLEAGRGEALVRLVNAWLNSTEHNDLRLIPHIEAEGEWHNDPRQTRQTVLELLNRLDDKSWWSISAFISAIQTHKPDFQRPTGEYDSWYLRDTRTGEYLRGFEHWQMADGALLHYLITAPLHWLGLVDLAAPDKDSPPVAFRFSKRSKYLFNGESPKGFSEEKEKITVDSKGIIFVPRLAPRALRYKIARFTLWEAKKRENYTYRFTPTTLTRAQEQGLEVKHLLTLLLGNSSNPIPRNVVQAIERWGQHGAQVQLESVMVLRVNHPKVLEKLQESRAKRFLGNQLGPTTITVKPGAWEKVVEALVEMGYLSEIKVD